MSSVVYVADMGINRQFPNRWPDNIGGTGKNKWDILRSPDFKLMMWKPLDGVFNSVLQLPAQSQSTLILVDSNNLLLQFTPTIKGI